MTPLESDKIIAHLLDGTLLKGTTSDFHPARPKFTVRDVDGRDHVLQIKELKALFFVRSYRGLPDHSERKGFFSRNEAPTKVMVEFFDGEVLFGHTYAYSAKGLGFFMVPGDPDSNNTRVFVVHSSTKRVKTKPAEKKRKRAHAGKAG